MKIKILISILLLTGGFNLFSQTFYIDPVYYSVFDQDSLKGFNENEARLTAIQGGWLGQELKVKMFRLKREFIDSKYNLVHPSINTYNYFPAKSSVLTSCLNEDFEASPTGVIISSNQISGWTVTGGYNGFVGSSSPSTLQAYFPAGLVNPNSCDLQGCCPMPPAHSEIIDCSFTGAYTDPIIGIQYPIYSVFGTGTVAGASAANPQINGGLFGTKFLRLNDMLTGDYSIERLSRTFAVTSSNSLFQLAFISVLSPGHNCCDGGGTQFKLRNALTNSVLSCPQLSLSAPGPQCTGPVPVTYYNTGTGTVYDPTVNFGDIYNPWKICSFDLSSYIGQALTLEIIVSDCNAGGHFGYIYLDAQCGEMKLNINNSLVSAVDSIINYTSCESVITLTSPDNYQSHQWTGPAGITSTSSILSTSVAGTYTLVLGQGLGCNLKRILNLSFSPTTGTITSSANLLCEGYPSILTAVGLTNCAWSTGDSIQNIYVAPLVNTTYTVSGINLYGCLVSAAITQSVTDCTGIEALNKNSEISIYPNPNTGEFSLIIAKEIKNGELVIESSLGQLVYKQSVQQGKNSIKTKVLPGIYYYKVTSDKEVITKGKLKIE